MAKWVFDQWNNTMDYPTLGFVAEPGDILDAVDAPDARWSVNADQGAAETVERYATGGSSGYVETTDGFMLTYDAAQNKNVPKAPADNALLGEYLSATSAAVADERIQSEALDPTGVIIRKAKDDNGGQYPAPLRVPVLTTETAWPNRHSPYVPCWVDGNTVYAHGRDSTLRKSTDGGATWTRQGYNSGGFGTYDCFLKTAAGTLLNIDSGRNIQRSTNDGANWTTVHSFRTDTNPLGAQSWCIDGDGVVWYGEYNSVAQAEIRLYKSTDDGATWTVVHTWPGEAVAGANPATYIRHIHSVQHDPISGRVIVSTGDSTPATGLYRTNATKDGVEPILTNAMIPAEDIDVPRSIGVMCFPDYLAWAGDTTSQPYVFRLPRSEIGQPSPAFERVYRLNSTAWWTVKASTDGSRWVVSASEEGTSLDDLVHLYAVEDQGATVWEVGAVATASTAPASSLQPVGRPEQSDRFYMVSRLFDTKTAYRFRLGRGLLPIARPEPMSPVLVPQTRSTGGAVTLAPSSEFVFGRTIAGGFARRLHIFESALNIVDLGGASAGSQRLRVRLVGATWATGDLEFVNLSERYSTRQDMGLSVDASKTFTGGQEVEFYVRNNSTTATTQVMASITFGWGLI